LSRDPLLLLEDIENSCVKIVRFTEGLGRDAVLADEMRFDAVLHNFQVVGEAAKRLPGELRQRHTDVPWREIAGMRDFVAHEYFALDREILWDAIQHNVPELLVKVRKILQLEEEARS